MSVLGMSEYLEELKTVQEAFWREELADVGTEYYHIYQSRELGDFSMQEVNPELTKKLLNAKLQDPNLISRKSYVLRRRIQKLGLGTPVRDSDGKWSVV